MCISNNIQLIKSPFMASSTVTAFAFSLCLSFSSWGLVTETRETISGLMVSREYKTQGPMTKETDGKIGPPASGH